MPEDDDSFEQQALVVSPAAIDFGTISVQGWGRAQQPFTIANAGTVPLSVHGHDEAVGLTGEGGVFEMDADPWFQLQPGEEREVMVTFHPPTDGDWQAEVRVNYGMEVLQLRGAATAPVMEVEPPELDPIPFGCSSSSGIIIRNTGREILALDGFALGEATDWVVGEIPPSTIPPDEQMRIPVVFQPSWTGAPGGERRTTLRVETNDPLQPEVAIPLASLVYEGESVVETFEYAPGNRTDLLIVADTDGVMALHVDKAQDALDTLLEALQTGNVDLHAAALTGSDLCPDSLPAWVDEDASLFSRIRALDAALEGPPGDGSEQLVVHASEALAGQSASGGCLEGFLRPGAWLHLVVIAGGADSSGLGAAELQDLLAAAAPEAEQIRVSAIIATDGAGCGGAAYGAGYAEVALATGGEILDLCQSDWGPGFERLADISVLAGEGGLSHPLELLPLEESLSVKVDGVGFSDWSYNAGTRAVVFEEATAPPTGSSIEVRYMAAVACP